jgi:hypothetical protein
MPMVIISIIMMNEKDPKKKVTEAKAEYMIIVEWPDDLDDDVDTYVEDPNGKLVFFRRREDGLMHLDRDDVGWRNDRIRLPDGTYTIVSLNQEVVSLRGIVPGEYVVNVHMYAMKSDKPIKVKIKLERMNPYEFVTIKELELEAVGREKTAFRFTLNEDGDVTDLNEIEKKIATDVGEDGAHGWEESESYEEEYEYEENP